MSVRIFRKEYFGGLLLDPERCRLTYLDPDAAAAVIARADENTIVHRRACPGRLSAPLKVFVSITPRCNLRCRHCVNEGSDNTTAALPLEVIRSLLEQMHELGVLEVRLSGGEPTCRADFFEIVEEAKRNSLTVSVNSNGVYPSHVLERLAHSRIDRIHVSLDGLEDNHDYVRGKGKFRESISAIRYLRQRGQYIRIVVCLFRNNLADIEGLIRLAEELDCDIKMSPIAGIGYATDMDCLLTPDECRTLTGRLDGRQSPVRVFCNYGTMLSKFAEHCAFDDFDSTQCGAGRTQLRLELDGNVFSGEGGLADADRAPIGTWRDPIAQLWDRAQSDMTARMKQKEPRCRECDLAQVMRKWLAQPSPSFNFLRDRSNHSRGQEENNLTC